MSRRFAVLEGGKGVDFGAWGEGYLDECPETDLEVSDLTPRKLAELRTTYPDFVDHAEQLLELTRMYREVSP